MVFQKLCQKKHQGRDHFFVPVPICGTCIVTPQRIITFQGAVGAAHRKDQRFVPKDCGDREHPGVRPAAFPQPP